MKRGEINTVCCDCFEGFHNAPSHRYIRCPKCRIGMKAKRSGQKRTRSYRGGTVRKSCRTSACPVCFRLTKSVNSKVCVRCWRKIQHMFIVGRGRGGKESPYGVSKYGQWYVRQARRWGVDIRERDLIIMGGFRMEHLAPWRRELLTGKMVRNVEHDFDDGVLAEEIEKKLEATNEDQA